LIEKVPETSAKSSLFDAEIVKILQNEIIDAAEEEKKRSTA
jgi:hypothetical protein